jgi:uncharacterized protein (DUF2336 family)
VIQAEAARVRQAAQGAGEALRSLTLDQSVTVRAALALNPKAPEDVDATLAHDPDERVRALIAGKLGGLLADPDLRARSAERLLALAEDAAERVRVALAEAVKNLPEAPRALILTLARDREISVCGPVIRLSPVLTDADLVALVLAAATPHVTRAVASRPGIGESVSEAVVAGADARAIDALLANPSARIREATLDALAASSSGYPSWQSGLVGRAALPPRVMRTLAGIVTDHLLEALAQRADLPLAVMDQVRVRLLPRAERPESTPEEALLEAVRMGDRAGAVAGLAAAAGVTAAVVERAAAWRAVKAVTALAWKAGLSASVAVSLQRLLTGVAPNALLFPGQIGGFALSEAEMKWQLALLDDAQAPAVSAGSACLDPIQ